MPFSYSGDPSESDLDAVRFLIGDTNSESYFLHNAEIEWLISTEGNAYAAAVAACRNIATTLSQQSGEFWAGSVRIINKEKAGEFLKLAESLRLKMLAAKARPFAGGVSVSDKETRAADTDRVKPAFTRNTHVPPGQLLGTVQTTELPEERT